MLDQVLLIWNKIPCKHYTLYPFSAISKEQSVGSILCDLNIKFDLVAFTTLKLTLDTCQFE